MITTEIAACIKIAACICGKDGFISQAEEEKIYELISSKFEEITLDEFNFTLDEFFSSKKQIEEYVTQIEDSSLHNYVVSISRESAAADGLDFRENIALQKLSNLWGINPNE